MSQTASHIDIRSTLAAWARRLGGMFVLDLKAIDESTFAQCPGGCARTIQDIAAEVASINDLMVTIIQGGVPQPRSEVESAAYKAQFTSKEFAISEIARSTEGLAQAIEQSTEENLARETQAPWGETMTVYELTNLTVNHILYHDGQLNYFQSLHGDGAMHWFDK